MSTDDKDAICSSNKQVNLETREAVESGFCEDVSAKIKPVRKVSFPDDEHIVTQYFEPANPWQDVPSTTRAQLAAEYLECCRRHRTSPIDTVLDQIRELPENAIGGAARASRLTLAECALLGAAPADALEAVLRKTQFRRLEIDHAAIDDEGAEALFDMVEYYESACAVCISGPRQFGIRGWQAASRMIKKSCQLSELEVTNHPLEASHAPVLARALHTHTCRLRALCLQRASLSGEPLLCLVIAMKSNNSLRELRLGDNRLSAADAAQLAALLRLNTRLQLLDLSNNQIQDAGAGHLTDALVEQAGQTPPSAAASPISPHQCPLSGYEARGLAVLVLWNNQLTRNCAAHLSKAVRWSQSLCVLNVGRNALGGDGARALAAGGALVSLGLQAARLGPDAARALAELVRADTRLQRLDLRENRLGVAGLQAILGAMEQNTSLTQIDLDDPTESVRGLTPEDSEAATVGRLVREVRARCRRNEPEPSPERERRAHRKISLTCHSAALAGLASPEDDHRAPHTASVAAGSSMTAGSARLRSPAPSPAPSPAGSPIPNMHHSRFSVTRVTPERESSAESSPSTPPRAAYSPAPSRFKVVQVAEPPQIHVHAADQPRRSPSSRFSVSRNYDSMYNPTPEPSPPSTPRPEPDRVSFEPDAVRPDPDKVRTQPDTVRPEFEKARAQPDNANAEAEKARSESDAARTVPNEVGPESDNASPDMIPRSEVDFQEPKSDKISDPANQQKSVESTDQNFTSDVCDASNGTVASDTSDSGIGNDVTSTESDNCVEGTVKSDFKNHDKGIGVNKSGKIDVVNDTNDVGRDRSVRTDVVSDKKDVGGNKRDEVTSKSEDSVNNPTYRDKSEEVSHSEEVDDDILKTETKLVKNTTEVSETEKVDVQLEMTVKTESVKPAKVHSDQNPCEFRNLDDINVNEKRDEVAMKQIEAITEDLSNLIQEMRDLSTKTSILNKKDAKVKSDCTQTDIDVNNIKLDKLDTFNNVPANFIRDNVVLKKNKSESSLDSPDLEVSRLMNKKMVNSPFCDSSSSLEISGSSMESLNLEHHHTIPQNRPVIIRESVETVTELDRRKTDHVTLSTESSTESTSEVPVNSNFLNMSVSSNESVSPIIFGKNKKLHGSISSLEASMSSIESARQEKVMVTSADSGIEYSLQNPIENKEDNSSNEGTLTQYSSLKETVKKQEGILQDTLTCSPKRAASLLDVPALKNKGLDRMRKISWVPPSSSFQAPKQEPEKTEMKLPSHLEKLLSLFQHPTSLFSRSVPSDEERKSASNTPPRKDSSLTSSFWSWGTTTGKEKEDKEDSSEATDSTLSERVQVSFVDESFSRKLDSKTPSTDTENTLSEFQSFPIQGNSETSEASQTERVTEITTDDNLVQKKLVLSVNVDNTSSKERASDIIDLMNPNDINKNYENAADNNKNTAQAESTGEDLDFEIKTEPVRPRSFAAVLKSSGSENSLEKPSPDSGQPVDKLPSKLIRGIKENISPENTLTESMTTTLALELSERPVKNQPGNNRGLEIPALDEARFKDEPKAPIATIEETCDESADNTVQLDYIDDIKFIDEKNTSADSGVTSLEGNDDAKKPTDPIEIESVDIGKDALSYLIYENQDFEPIEQAVSNVSQEGSLAQELKEAEIKEKLLDLSPELVIDEAIEVPEVFATKDLKGHRTSPVIPERAKLKKSNSLENILQTEKDNPKSKTIAFTIPESTTPRDIPERRGKLRSRSGSSPKSLPESLKHIPISKLDSVLTKKKKRVSSLGKIARDSLLALNMSEEEIAEFRRSYKLTSVESLKSLESVSEDANSQSGTSVDSRCRSCLRTSQESLISLDSITEDCRCTSENAKEKPGRCAR